MQSLPSERTGAAAQPRCEIGPAAAADLDAINRVVEDAMRGWNINARLRRLSLPLYRYGEQDLEHLEFALARTPAIVGVAALELPALSAGPAAALLHGLYVAPERQRAGVGGVLLRWAELDALQRGIGTLRVRARPEAVAFFEARGYLPVVATGVAAAYPWLLQKDLSL